MMTLLADALVHYALNYALDCSILASDYLTKHCFCSQITQRPLGEHCFVANGNKVAKRDVTLFVVALLLCSRVLHKAPDHISSVTCSSRRDIINDPFEVPNPRYEVTAVHSEFGNIDRNIRSDLENEVGF